MNLQFLCVAVVKKLKNATQMHTHTVPLDHGIHFSLSPNSSLARISFESQYYTLLFTMLRETRCMASNTRSLRTSKPYKAFNL